MDLELHTTPFQIGYLYIARLCKIHNDTLF